MHDKDESIRIDKWLWAARFFKTRSLAAAAVAGGKIEVNGERSKPSRVVHLGDRLNIRRGPYEWDDRRRTRLALARPGSASAEPLPGNRREYQQTRRAGRSIEINSPTRI